MHDAARLPSAAPSCEASAMRILAAVLCVGLFAAAGRVERNSTAPRMMVRFSEDRVYTIRYEKAPEMADRIADAMAEKYWSDFLGEPFRKLGLSSPPVMLRLVPDESAAGSGGS